jgi:uncharacterized hydrophobic protein (TIGR00341 family)
LKKLEVTVTLDQSDKVKELFEQMELLYSSSTITIEKGKCAWFSALIPDQLVDEAVHKISDEIDLRLRENTLSFLNVEGTVSTYLDRLKERATKASPPSNPLERLVESTEQYTHLSWNILTMSAFAAMVALAGLFLNNVAVVIGAMLLSPLLGPINAFAVNTSLGRLRKLTRSQLSILLLLAFIIVLSAVTTFTASQVVPLSITDQIALRSQASLIDVGIAFVLGLAGGLALFIAIPEILVGVAVAVALLPPAAVTGIGLALSDTALFVGALLLTLVNLIGLQLGGTLMLRAKGVSPRRYYQKAEARIRSAYSILILSVLLIILGLIQVL